MPAFDASRLLVSTGPLLFSPLDWVLDAIADAGFTGAELMLTHNPATRNPEVVAACAANAGLRIPVVHGPYLLLLRNVLGAGYIDKTRRSLALAAEMGAETMVAHAPFRWEGKARGWAAAEAEAEGEALGTTYAMENLFPVGGYQFSSAVTVGDLAAFGSVVFDTSHFAVAGIDLFAAWEALHKRVAHVHVSDNFGDGKDSHGPIGSGMLPLKAFLAHVGASQYTGTITLELDCRAYLDSRTNLIAFLAQERQKAQTLLVGQGADTQTSSAVRRPNRAPAAR